MKTSGPQKYQGTPFWTWGQYKGIFLPAATVGAVRLFIHDRSSQKVQLESVSDSSLSILIEKPTLVKAASEIPILRYLNYALRCRLEGN